MVQKIIYKTSYLLIFILIANSIFNLFRVKFSINISDILVGFTLFIMLFIVGKCIDQVLKVQSISFSIFIYLASFYLVDILILFFVQTLYFKEVFFITNIIWGCIFILSRIKIISFFLISFIYFLLNYLFNMLQGSLSENQNIIGDVEAVFFKQSQNIYEISYFYSVNNFVMEGYPQFTSYLQSLFLQFSQYQGNYNYYIHTSHIIFYLSILFFWELNISTKNKVLLIAVFSSLILNSGWLSFLFTSSLMSEGIVSLFTTICLYYLLNSIQNNYESKYEVFFYVTIGMLYFTKQFNSSIVLIFIAVLYLLDRKKKIILFGFTGLILKELLHVFVFDNVSKDHHIRQIDYIDTIADIFLLRDLKLSNILLILRNLFIDKPLVVVIVVFYLSILLVLLQSFQNNIVNYSLFFLVNLNLVFIFGLYISVWQNMELDSPIRYILNLLHMALISSFLNLDKSKN